VLASWTLHSCLHFNSNNLSRFCPCTSFIQPSTSVSLTVLWSCSGCTMKRCESAASFRRQLSPSFPPLPLCFSSSISLLSFPLSYSSLTPVAVVLQLMIGRRPKTLSMVGGLAFLCVVPFATSLVLGSDGPTLDEGYTPRHGGSRTLLEIHSFSVRYPMAALSPDGISRCHGLSAALLPCHKGAQPMPLTAAVLCKLSPGEHRPKRAL